MNAYAYKVGSLYNPKVTSWPEAIQYNFRGGQHELLLFMIRPSPSEIEAVNTGRAQFALFVRQPAIFLLSRFGDAIDWCDSVYSIFLVPENERTLPSVHIGPDERALLTVMLIDSTDGIIRAMRALTFSPEFTKRLHTAIHEQYNVGWLGNDVYDRHINGIYQRYPDSRKMLKDAECKCNGGE